MKKRETTTVRACTLGRFMQKKRNNWFFRKLSLTVSLIAFLMSFISDFFLISKKEKKVYMIISPARTLIISLSHFFLTILGSHCIIFLSHVRCPLQTRFAQIFSFIAPIEREIKTTASTFTLQIWVCSTWRLQIELFFLSHTILFVCYSYYPFCSYGIVIQGCCGEHFFCAYFYFVCTEKFFHSRGIS
jgi:hypothetical protein